MVGFLGIVLFFTYLNLVLCNSCDPNHGTEGMYDCVRIPRYDGYQWSVCLSRQSLRIHTSGHMSCQGSNFCWLPCTQSIYPKSKSGHIPKECKCDPVENERRKRSLIAKGRESKVSVSPVCYVPSWKSNCQWYSKCLESHSPCERSDFHYAISYGGAMCSIFLEGYSSFSENGMRWVRSSQECIEDRMKLVLMPNNTADCRKIRERAYKVHFDCYFKSSNPRFCNLLHTDQQKIYWSIKQLYEHAFYETFDKVMAKFRSCLRNDVYKEQRKFMFYVEKEVDQYVDENTFSSELAAKFAFSSHGLDWDVDKTLLRVRRNAYKPKEYQIVRIFVSKRQVEVANEWQGSLRKTRDSIYDATFMDAFKTTITIALRDNALEVLEIGSENQRIVGLVEDTGAERTMCFPVLGCFRSLWKQLIDPLPDTPKSINTKFYLHDRGGKSIQLNDDSTFENFDPNKKTIVIIPGYSSSGSVSWVLDLKNVILIKEDANVIVVDWENGAWGWYPQAAVNTEIVGNTLASLVRSLEGYWGTTITYFHIIGHSLGAHVAGFAGGAHKERRYDRITGLDPAGILFKEPGRETRLDETDAKFVDVIHTNGGFGLGNLYPMGHVDFYPNGGHYQRACYYPSCSHSRAHRLFTESILSDHQFRAWRCSSLKECTSGKIRGSLSGNKMGYYTDTSIKNAMYYLKTNEITILDFFHEAYEKFKTKLWRGGFRNACRQIWEFLFRKERMLDATFTC